MRDGQLLAESEPNALITFYGMRVLTHLNDPLCYYVTFHNSRI